MTNIMTAPVISENIWGDEPEQAYYTVYVYKHTGLGDEATVQNVLAVTPEDAMARVAGSKPWLRTNPMYAYKQDGRI
jgi:hypothetical protein